MPEDKPPGTFVQTREPATNRLPDAGYWRCRECSTEIVASHRPHRCATCGSKLIVDLTQPFDVDDSLVTGHLEVQGSRNAALLGGA